MDTVKPQSPRWVKPSAMLRSAASSRLSKAIGGQALVSVFHFATNLALLPLLSTHDYGVFALSFVLAMFAAAINNALISTPLSIYTPVIEDKTARHHQEALFNALNTAFFTALIAVGIVFSVADHAIALPVALFVASYATRQFSRSFAYARLKAEIPARADTLYVLIAGSGTALSIVAFGNQSVQAILLALCLGNTAASLLEFYLLRDAWRMPKSLRDIKAYASLWPQTRWALIGAFTTLLMGQAHSIIVSSSFGPAAFAPLAAGGVLFGPIRVALTTWQNMSKPQMAIDLKAKQFAAVAAYIKKTTLLMTVALAGVALALWLFWPLIDSLLYAHKYRQEPMGFIVSVWLLITLFFTFNSPAAAVLQALADFKVLAIASVYGALISTVIVLALLYSQGPTVTLYGGLAAEVFMSAYLLYYLKRSFRKAQA